MKNNCCIFERLDQILKNDIKCHLQKVFSFLESDNIVNSSKNISKNIGAVLFKLGTSNHKRKIRGSLEQPHGMNCLHPWVTCDLVFVPSAKFIHLFVGYTCRTIIVRRDWLKSKRDQVTVEEKIVIVIIQKGNWHFFEIRNIVNQHKIVSLLIFANRCFPWKMDFLVCLFVNHWYH